MKILVVTAYYPPHHIGGYEIGCRDVANQLRLRGHEVQVLTSDFRFPNQNSPDDPGVIRTLLRHSSGQQFSKIAECRKFAQVCKTFQPEVVYFWSQSELCNWLPVAAHWLGCRSVFFLSDTNFMSWRVGAWLAGAAGNRPLIPTLSPQRGEGEAGRRERFTAKIVRSLFGNSFLVRGWPVIENCACHFASDFLRQVAMKHGIPFASRESIVAHWGIEPATFSTDQRPRWPVRRLLYAGQMIPQKGVHTAIAMFVAIAKEKGFEDLTFTLAGGGMHPDYELKLRAQAGDSGCGDRIHFLGKVPRADLPRIYAEHDVLIFPSEWDEPFAITPLEAIASGLAVVGTTTGGSGELFRNHETAMTFRAGDAEDCARAIRELSADHELFEKICRKAQQEVREKHTLDAMVDKIESSLRSETVK